MQFVRSGNRRSKRKKRRKSSCGDVVGLSQRDKEYLRRHTRFDEEEIEDWYR